MNQHSPIEQYEYDFVSETFSQDWPIIAIANKIERPVSTITAIVQRLSLKRSSHNVRTPKTDWPSIWYAYQTLGSYRQAALATGLSSQLVRYAITKMVMMGNTIRLLKWNAYARKNDRETYLQSELNIGSECKNAGTDNERLRDNAAIEKLNISREAIYNRLRRGWSEKDALEKPVMTKSERARAGGLATSKGIADAARVNGMSESVVYRRIALGWSLDRAVSTPVRFRSPSKS